MAKRRKKPEAIGDDWRAQIRACTDMYPPDDQLDYFRELAIAEDVSNVIPGLSQAPASGYLLPVRVAFVTGKKWANGRSLRVAFMGGTSAQQEFVARTADKWSNYCSITFQWGVAVAQSEVRITFDRNGGAWCFIGTDNLGIPKNRATMNLGWLDEAVVIHEFGHLLSAIHEHQHPTANIPWNKPNAYRFYGGPPNNWDRATIDSNIFGKYSVGQTQFSEYDPKSVMHYPIPKELLTDPSRTVGWNQTLSARDTEFVARVYPKGSQPPPTSGGIEIPATGTYQILTDPDGKKTLVFGGQRVTMVM